MITLFRSLCKKYGSKFQNRKSLIKLIHAVNLLTNVNQFSIIRPSCSDFASKKASFIYLELNDAHDCEKKTVFENKAFFTLVLKAQK